MAETDVESDTCYIRDEIGARIRWARQSAKLTQQALADKIAVPRVLISRSVIIDMDDG